MFSLDLHRRMLSQNLLCAIEYYTIFVTSTRIYEFQLYYLYVNAKVSCYYLRKTCRSDQEYGDMPRKRSLHLSSSAGRAKKQVAMLAIIQKTIDSVLKIFFPHQFVGVFPPLVNLSQPQKLLISTKSTKSTLTIICMHQFSISVLELQELIILDVHDLTESEVPKEKACRLQQTHSRFTWSNLINRILREHVVIFYILQKRDQDVE